MTYSALAFSKISFYKLKANPEKYDGQFVELVGVFCARTDAIYIYPSTEHCKKNISSYGIGLKVSEEYYVKREEYGHLQFRAVSGKVNTHKKSVFEVYETYLTDVSLSAVGDKSNLHQVLYELVDDKKKYEVIKFSKSWLQSVRLKNKREIAKGLNNPADGPLENHKRANWVLYDANNAISKMSLEGKRVRAYRYYDYIRDSEEYMVCITRQDIVFHNLIDVPEPLSRQEDFCIPVSFYDDSYFVDASWLLY